ncbi:MAG TPA: hypothetical protein VKQ30_20850 [Ktedonobacterales bacterium]|nr:hypothetical protein [Ktedonobacterales bacterium]
MAPPLYPPKGKGISGRAGVAINVSSTDAVVNFDSLWVGVTGNITLTGEDGVDVAFTNVPVGFFNMSGTTVRHIGTTASGLVAVTL